MPTTQTISGTYSGQVTLSATYTTISPTGLVQNTVTNGTAITGGSIAGYTLVNAGQVLETASGGVGISFAQSGTITNASGGTIAAAANALDLSGGYVTNASGGGITASGGYAILGQNSALTVVNAGLISAASSYGIQLEGGGTVTNLSGGTITGSSGIVANYASATVVNDGSIAGSLASGLLAAGVSLTDGGQVTNQSGGRITGMYGVEIQGATGTVVNLGFIQAQRSGSYIGYVGVLLQNGGTIINGASGGTVSAAYINGYHGGVAFKSSTPNSNTLINYGTVTGNPGQNAVGMATGLVINGPSGDIAAQIVTGGAYAVSIAGAGTVINYATIVNVFGPNGGPLYSGVHIGGGGTVQNIGNGSLIEGYVAVYANGGATVTNAGTIMTNDISGSEALAVQLGTGTNRLIVDPGAVFVGKVTAAGTSTLELASASSVGTIGGIGAQYAGFSQVTIDSGATWNLTGNNTVSSLTNSGQILDSSILTVTNLAGTGGVTIAAGASMVTQGTVAATQTIDFAAHNGQLQLTPANFSATIDGFGTGDTIALTGVTNATGVTVVNGNTLEVTLGTGGPIDLTLNPAQSLSGATFQYGTHAGNTDITATNLACFVTGTLIRTTQGDVPVEALREGDDVLTQSGAVRPVRWIGMRHLDLARHPNPERAQPIRIKAHALADAVPSRDLLLSPDHAVLLDGCLIPARLLLNGASIRREAACRSVCYYHVELDAHDVLLAEGAPAESYLDTGNRGIFENAGVPVVLHPDLTNDQTRREAHSCAPFADTPDVVEPIWHRLADRTHMLGMLLPAAPETTDDASLCVLVNGRRLEPTGRVKDGYVFVIPAEGEVRMASRCVVPSELTPWVEDRRRLGVMVRGLVWRCGDEVVPVPVDHPDLLDGWWAPEWHGPHELRRWTNGDAHIPRPSCERPGPRLLQVLVASALHYPLETTSAEVGKHAMREAA